MLLPKPKRTPPNPDTVREIYIDETSQTKHRYLMLGGICLPLPDRAAAEAALASVRLPELPYGEAKWGRVSKFKLDPYERIVTAFFEDKAFSNAHFHSVVVDTHALNDKVYNEGSREIGFNKEIYQLANKCARLYPGVFHVYPDSRETNQRPEDLRAILNHGRRKTGDRRDWPFRRCQFRDSKKTPLLQMVDILLGAIAYHVNCHNLGFDASEAKIRLSNRVLKLAKIEDVMRDTAIRGKFTIWHRQLRRSSPGLSR